MYCLKRNTLVLISQFW